MQFDRPKFAALTACGEGSSTQFLELACSKVRDENGDCVSQIGDLYRFLAGFSTDQGWQPGCVTDFVIAKLSASVIMAGDADVCLFWGEWLKETLAGEPLGMQFQDREGISGVLLGFLEGFADFAVRIPKVPEEHWVMLESILINLYGLPAGNSASEALLWQTEWSAIHRKKLTEAAGRIVRTTPLFQPTRTKSINKMFRGIEKERKIRAGILSGQKPAWNPVAVQIIKEFRIASIELETIDQYVQELACA